MRTLTLSVVAGLFAVAAGAQAQAGNPVSDALRMSVKSADRNFVGAADLMPAEKYGYHPTEAQMTFGQLVLHVATSNEFLCERINGTPAPTEAKLTPTSPKAELVARVKRSFAYCADGFAKLTDAGLADSVPFFGGRKVTRAGAMMDIAADWADHYGAAAIYLRLNGILPPTARGRGGM
ncbi:MAG: DinB family protein [Gemmatimonadota bacterium]|nr:DinB family protein [Gemmatimonadota bacterium]MDE3129202.1 DinB family protein [Gemmatimonadota bacterium]MDE3172866.1 DinB family protein [Gemmatimonadota bacterium]MDE3215967.1 DinB family protein [Gemmatimonadota bacterium]